MASRHEGGLHPNGGYRSADVEKEPKPPHKFTTLEKVVGVFIVGPILFMIFTGLIALTVKFAQICLAWIS